MFQYDIQVHDS